MEKLVLSLLFGLILIIILGVLSYHFYLSKLGTKSIFSPLYAENSQILKVQKLKSQVEFHLNWAQHSGDKDRVQALQSELLNLDLKISELTITPN